MSKTQTFDAEKIAPAILSCTVAITHAVHAQIDFMEIKEELVNLYTADFGKRNAEILVEWVMEDATRILKRVGVVYEGEMP